MFEKELYLKRIGFVPVPGETRAEQLRRLHLCHSRAIPFEDFSPLAGIDVSTAPEDIFDKVVLHRRGGYCFELNPLFGELLRSMGYDARPIICRAISLTGEVRPLTHCMNLVDLDGETWICDVGYGNGGWNEPLRLAVGEKQTVGDESYVIREGSYGWYIVRWQKGELERDAVTFPLAPALPGDYVIASYYNCTTASSTFTNNIMCKRPTEDAAYTIRGNLFKITRGEDVESRILTADTLEDVLDRYFDIELPPRELEAAKDNLRKLAAQA